MAAEEPRNNDGGWKIQGSKGPDGDGTGLSGFGPVKHTQARWQEIDWRGTKQVTGSLGPCQSSPSSQCPAIFWGTILLQT